MKMRRIKPKENQSASRKRSNFRILIILIAVISLWRGIWALFDLYVFPYHPEVSALASIVIGLTILWLDDHRLDEI